MSAGAKTTTKTTTHTTKKFLMFNNTYFLDQLC